MNMTSTAAILEKMIIASNGSAHDINHLIKVHSYAKIIGELEELDMLSQYILEIAAIVHDIACPMLREKYGHSDGRLQEQEGPAMAAEFLAQFDLGEPILERVLYLVGHHHSPESIDGDDYRILLEADYIVNAGECGFPHEDILKTRSELFRTKAGTGLLSSIYGL